MVLWWLCLKNLWRNPRRTLVTGLAIATGFAGLSLFNGYVHRVERMLAVLTIYSNHTGHLSIMKKNWIENGVTDPHKFTLSSEEQLKLKGFFKNYESEISYQTQTFTSVGLISNGCRSVPYFFKGLNPEFRRWIKANEEYRRWAPLELKTYAGKDFTVFSEAEFPLMVTENLARLLNKKTLYENAQSLPPPMITDCQSVVAKLQNAQDPSVQLMTKTMEGGVSAIDANIVGYFSFGLNFLDDMGIQGPLSLMQKLYDDPLISHWVIFLKNPLTLNEWKKHLRPEFQKLFPDLEMLFYDEARLSPFYVGTAHFLKSLSLFFVVIAGLVIALTIINSLTMSMIERSKEIGTLRALGYNENQVAQLLGREMTLLMVFSLAGGGLLNLLLTALINGSGITFDPPGASGVLYLEIAPDYLFQVSVAGVLCLVVGLLSYGLAQHRLKINTVELLAETTA